MQIAPFSYAPFESTIFDYAMGAARLLPTTLLVPAFARTGGPLMRASLAFLLAAGSSVAAGVTLPRAPGAGVAQLVLSLLAGLPVALAARTALVAASGSFALGDDLAGLTTKGPRKGPLEELAAVLAAYVYFASGGVARTVNLVAASDFAGDHALLLRTVPTTLLAGIGIAASFAAPWLVARLFVELVILMGERASVGAPLRAGGRAMRGLLRGPAWGGVRRTAALVVFAALVESTALRLASLLP